MGGSDLGLYVEQEGRLYYVKTNVDGKEVTLSRGRHHKGEADSDKRKLEGNLERLDQIINSRLNRRNIVCILCQRNAHGRCLDGCSCTKGECARKQR